MSRVLSQRVALNAYAKPREFSLKVFLYGLGLITLFFYSSLVDPFNSPKAWILDLCAMWLLGYLIYDFTAGELSRDEKIALIVIGAFIAAMLLALLGTHQLFTGFFGSYGRRTGFLSYFSLAIFSIAGFRIIRLNNLIRTDNSILVIGSIASIYGLAQHYGYDFVSWNNPFNPVISTVGNPDFASAMLGIIAVLCFGIGVNSFRRFYMRVWALLIFLTSMLAVVFSKSFQGLLISALGVGVILLVWIYQCNKIAGHLSLGAGVLVGLFSIMGMLQFGPLSQYFYKASVTYRGDYWRAGINMFTHHLWLGVGLDRYGENYRQYRDLISTLRRGPDVVSNAAHNVFIQLAATGGIFLLLSYAVMTIFIFWRGIEALKRSSGNSQLAVATVFAAWIAYVAQSVISIDNLGVAIWGWVLGGMVIGISLAPRVKSDESVDSLQPKEKVARKGFSPELSYVISTLLVLAMLVLIVPLIVGDKEIVASSDLQLPINAQQSAYFTNVVEKPLHNLFPDPDSILVISGKLAEGSIHSGGNKPNQSMLQESENLLINYLKNDRNNYQFTSTLCEIYEQTGALTKALPWRKLNTVLDPFNTQNWLQYGLDMKAAGDNSQFAMIRTKIMSIDPKGADAQKAREQLV